MCAGVIEPGTNIVATRGTKLEGLRGQTREKIFCSRGGGGEVAGDELCAHSSPVQCANKIIQVFPYQN